MNNQRQMTFLDVLARQMNLAFAECQAIVRKAGKLHYPETSRGLSLPDQSKGAIFEFWVDMPPRIRSFYVKGDQRVAYVVGFNGHTEIQTSGTRGTVGFPAGAYPSLAQVTEMFPAHRDLFESIQYYYEAWLRDVPAGAITAQHPGGRYELF